MAIRKISPEKLGSLVGRWRSSNPRKYRMVDPEDLHENALRYWIQKAANSDDGALARVAYFEDLTLEIREKRHMWRGAHFGFVVLDEALLKEDLRRQLEAEV